MSKSFYRQHSYVELYHKLRSVCVNEKKFSQFTHTERSMSMMIVTLDIAGEGAILYMARIDAAAEEPAA